MKRPVRPIHKACIAVASLSSGARNLSSGWGSFSSGASTPSSGVRNLSGPKNTPSGASCDRYLSPGPSFVWSLILHLPRVIFRNSQHSARYPHIPIRLISHITIHPIVALYVPLRLRHSILRVRRAVLLPPCRVMLRLALCSSMMLAQAHVLRG
ncbi:hypothetical protein F5B20DRAFT_25395 [Whalleya microplaca]|nr:hypothetical protein F5B20DRAFT_25395 [Whalleya microplaca]